MAEESKPEEATPLISYNEMEQSSYASVREKEESSMGSSDEKSSGNRSKPAAAVDAAASIESAQGKPRKRKGLMMNYDSALVVEYHIQTNMLMHRLAAEHFNFRQFWVFEVHQGWLTAVSSILAFVATTELVGEHTKLVLTTIVGATAILVGFLQAMNGLCAYGTRAVMHQAVALDLREMRNHIRLLRVKLGFIESAFGEEVPAILQDVEEGEDEEEDNIGTFESIQTKFEQSLFGCKSPIPIEICEAFEGLSSSVASCGSLLNGAHFVKVYGAHYKFTHLNFKFNDVLAEQIMDYPFFPFALPRASESVKKAMQDCKESMKRDQELYCND